MKRLIVILLSIIGLAMSDAIYVSAQSLSADRFLNGIAAHPVGDQAEQDQSSEIWMALNSTSSEEVKRVFPVVLQYARSGNEIHVRRYAIMFLLSIAMRPDGPDLLSSMSDKISALLTDDDPGAQKVAVGITDWVIANPATNKQPYLSALKEVLKRPQTQQEVVLIGMIGPLLTYGSKDPDALKSVLAFLHRDDLTRGTRSSLVHELGVEPGLPKEVTQYLIERLDDPDPWVRAAAVAAFADSTNQFYTTDFHTLAKDRVARMANDPLEHPEVREKAKQAIAGKTALDPNIYSLPDDHRKDH
jgi:hypothetical protein